MTSFGVRKQRFYDSFKETKQLEKIDEFLQRSMKLQTDVIRLALIPNLDKTKDKRRADEEARRAAVWHAALLVLQSDSPTFQKLHLSKHQQIKSVVTFSCWENSPDVVTEFMSDKQNCIKQIILDTK